MKLTYRSILTVLIVSLLGAPRIRAADDAFHFYEEEAQVVSASRWKEPARLAPVAIDVVTAEDIRAYGYTDIWDALRFRVGMDVIDGRSLDGNRALVSARGFTTEFVAELQVLIDGRSVYSPFLGGVYWQSLPVQMQDIERIEIVRGPNAVLYGSNAGLGVINIITRQPSASKSIEVAATGSSRSGVRGSAAADAGVSDTGLRLSYTGRNEEGHPDSDGTSNGNDFLNTHKINGRGRWKPWAATEIELLSGGSWLTSGLPGLINEAQSQQRQNFESLKITHALRGADALELQLSRTESRIEIAPVFAGNVTIRTYQYDADFLHRSTWFDDRLKSAWGSSWREMGADSDQSFSPDSRQSNRLVRGFTHHSLRVFGPLTIVAGVSVEHSGTGGTQEAWHSALLLTPTEEQTLRLSYAVAPTIPPLFDQHANYALAPGQTFVGNRSYRPEKLSSWEAGWTSRFWDGAIKPSIALYYMEIAELGALVARPGGILTIQNSDHAVARGIEASTEFSLSPARSIFANYTFENVTHRTPPSPTGYDASRVTPLHKFNIGARTNLGKTLLASFVIGYKDQYLASSTSRAQTAAIPRHFRLDARLGWTPHPAWTFFIAGHELLQRSFNEYVDDTATPRSVNGGVEVRFGL